MPFFLIVFVLFISTFSAFAGDEGYRYLTPTPLSDHPVLKMLFYRNRPPTDCYKIVNGAYILGRNPGYIGECGDMTGMDISNRKLGGISFLGAVFQDVIADNTTFVNFSFVAAHVNNSSFKNAKFIGNGNFSLSRWEKNDFRGADLSAYPYLNTVDDPIFAGTFFIKNLVDSETRLPQRMEKYRLYLSGQAAFIDTTQKIIAPTHSWSFHNSGIYETIKQHNYVLAGGDFTRGESLHGFRPNTVEIDSSFKSRWLGYRNHYSFTATMYDGNGKVIAIGKTKAKLGGDEYMTEEGQATLCASAFARMLEKVKN